MTPALAHKVEAYTSQQEPQKRQPLYQGTYLARDSGGTQIQVEVISVRDGGRGNGKKRILCVLDFEGTGIYTPAHKTGLDFFFLVARSGPLPVDLGHY